MSNVEQTGISVGSGNSGGIDLKAQPSILRMTDEQGKLVTLSLDSRTTTVFREGRPAKLEALQVGQRVKVEAISKEGKQFAKTVEVLPASPAAPLSKEQEQGKP